jgi:hypothetical protein
MEITYGSVCSGIATRYAVGQRFGRLVVTEVYAPKRRDQVRLKCVCDCGQAVDIAGGRLWSGETKSCGCFRRDRAGELYKKHGKSQTQGYCLFYDARKRATSKGLPFNLDPEDIVIPEFCPVFGFRLSAIGHRDVRPTIDRLVPELGYTKSNIRIISFRANRIKSDATASELLKILEYMGHSIC